MKTPFCTFLLFSIGICTSGKAQQTAIYTNDQVQYHRATGLYDNQQFRAAQSLFSEIKHTTTDANTKAECAYYEASCAVWLNQKGADAMIEDFVKSFPLSTKRNAAYLEVAHYNFDHGKYAYARKWYAKVDKAGMNRSARERFDFNNGYAYFKAQRFNEATKYFNQVAESEEYGAQAKYYLGFIAYEGDNYVQANKLFDEVKDLNTYNKNLSYFQSDMSFKSGDFQKAIDAALEQLPTSNPKEKSQLNKIIGESYFNLQAYEQAIPYLKAYGGRNGKWSNTDYYQLGYAYYQQGAFKTAISEFNKIIDGRNAVAQNAYYHLAQSYLDSGQKQQALNAFKNAAEMNFETNIQEDAFYNYAKLSYEIGNSYQSVPEVLQAYLKSYPNSIHKEAVQQLLIDSFITSKNYKAAIALLEKNRAIENKSIYQKVTFYRGLELYNEGNYVAAKTHFDKSLSANQEKTFAANATYWKAECDYALSKFDLAAQGFKAVENMPEAKEIEAFNGLHYALAYTFFKQKNYANAITYFERYIGQSKTDKDKKIDGYMRLGDSYFISRDYWPAMEAYNQAIALGGSESDYAHFQKAMSYGFVGKNAKKIEDLKAFLATHKKSVYRDDALYELGNVYVAEKKTGLGIQSYQRLQNELKTSSFVPKALLKEGLIYYNSDRGEQALKVFKKVAADYPGTAEANQAVATGRLVYIDLGRTDEYAAWVKNLDFVSVSETDLDHTGFEAAEKQYLENNDNQAIAGFKKYLATFPSGLHALQSHYYLAELLFKKEDNTAAIPHYEYVISKEGSEYMEQSLARLSQLYLEQKNPTKAIPLLVKLEEIANFPQNIIFAQSNLMKSYYQLKSYEKTVAYAEKVLSNSKIQQDVKSDAQLFIARSAMKTGDEVRAQIAYTEVQKIQIIGAVGAEAGYYEAYFAHKAKDYKQSNKAIQKLAKDFSGYKYFGAKGLVLMAKNFYGMEDVYQATYILDNVIKNFTDFSEVVQEAKETLKSIKAEAAKTNSSVAE